MTRAEQKAIAIERMKALKLFTPCINAFKSRNEIQMSEPTGGLYEISGDEVALSIVKEFETVRAPGAMVYHIIHTYTEFGELYNVLFVESEYEYPEMGEEIMTDIQDGYVFVWCKNATDDFCSEFGTISVRERFGGLVRVG